MAKTPQKKTGRKSRKIEPIQYRDEKGVRLQVYRRFKEEVDYIPLDHEAMTAMAEMAKKSISRRNGRPPTFESIEELQAGIEAYWDYIIKANQNGVSLIPDVEGLAAYLGVNRETLKEWDRSNYRGFSATIKETFNRIAAIKKQLGLKGQIPPIVMAMDFNNNHGYTQKQELEVTAKTNKYGEEPTEEELRARIEADVIVDDD